MSPFSYPTNSFPNRYIQKEKPPVELSLSELEKCVSELGVHLRSLIPNVEEKVKVWRLLYQYHYMNSVDLLDLPPTDHIIHRIKLAPGVIPHSVSQQRWPQHMEWWLQKLVQGGIKGEFMNEQTYLTADFHHGMRKQ